MPFLDARMKAYLASVSMTELSIIMVASTTTAVIQSIPSNLDGAAGIGFAVNITTCSGANVSHSKLAILSFADELVGWLNQCLTMVCYNWTDG